jgi:DeoR/GlpR family transcriptional regulator of sugar metabolism
MRVPDHVVQARRQRLALLLARRQYLPVAEVCSAFGVSEPTARRDLAALAADHAITRTHGGARVEYNQKFPSFRDRLALASPSKERIAAAAVRLLRPGMTVWLDGGTTLYAVARRLAEAPPRGIVVVTNNLPAAELLADIDAVAVHLLGGQYYRRTSLLLGGGAPEAARRWRFDLALLGVEGVTSRGLWNSLEDVVVLQRAVLRVSARSVVCADASKIGRPAADFLGPLSDVNQILTDAPLSKFRDEGIRLAPGQWKGALSSRLMKGEKQP